MRSDGQRLAIGKPLVIPAFVYLVWQVAGYLIGGIPFGWLVCKQVAGIDIRKVGSGNIGATNVGRTLGFKYFLLVFLLDAAKGIIPTAAAIWFQGLVRFEVPMEGLQMVKAEFAHLPELVGLAAILGHLFPIYLNGLGGKGVATSLGVFLILFPTATLISLVVFGVLLLTVRIMSVGSILFALCLIAIYFWQTKDPFGTKAWVRTLFLIGVASMVIVKHRTNIIRLLSGTEPKLDLFKSKSATQPDLSLAMPEVSEPTQSAVSPAEVSDRTSG